MSNDKKTFNDGYSPKKSERGYQPKKQIPQPSDGSKLQGGYIPITSGGNNKNPPGKE